MDVIVIIILNSLMTTNNIPLLLSLFFCYFKETPLGIKLSIDHWFATYSYLSYCQVGELLSSFKSMLSYLPKFAWPLNKCNTLFIKKTLEKYKVECQSCLFDKNFLFTFIVLIYLKQCASLLAFMLIEKNPVLKVIIHLTFST